MTRPESTHAKADEVQIVINLDVPDLQAARAFYTAAFGFRVGRRLGASTLELLGGAVPLYLLEKTAGSQASAGASAQRTYERHWATWPCSPIRSGMACA
jgi:catechol 2,3-dioxygenase-like lactoylglutathione lyase family enzyme